MESQEHQQETAQVQRFFFNWGKEDEAETCTNPEHEKWVCVRGTGTKVESSKGEKKKYKILVVDGGGIRGLVAAMLCQKIEESLGKPINELFDMLVGTSTGGIIAAGLAHGMKASELVDLYKNKGSEIFQSRFGTGYSSSGLKKNLESVLQDKTFRDVTNVQVGCETARILQGNGDAEGILLSNMNDKYLDVKLVDATMATSAAPTYFDSHHIPGFGFFVDGGVVQNNPSLLAYSEASRYVKNPRKELFMCSLSTGMKLSGVKPDDMVHNGMIDYAKWGVNGVNYCMNSNSRQVPKITCRAFAPDDFFRFNPESVALAEMDDVGDKNIEALTHVAEAILKSPDFAEFLERLKSMPKFERYL